MAAIGRKAGSGNRHAKLENHYTLSSPAEQDPLSHGASLCAKYVLSLEELFLTNVGRHGLA